jgi:hypothetical protein
MKLYALVIALAFALPAAAGGDHENHGHNNGDPGTSQQPLNNEQGQGQAQGQDQDQQQGQKQSQSASSKSASNSKSVSNSNADASNNGNAQLTTITNTSPKAPVNTAVAGLGETTAACRYHDGGGLQLAGVGLSLGKSRKDGDCERLKLAEFLYQRGNDLAGDRVMCNIKAIKEALDPDCLALVHELKAVTVEDGKGHEYVTPKQLDNALRSAAQK